MLLAGELSASQWLFRGASIGQFQWATSRRLFAEQALQLVRHFLLQLIFVLVELLLHAGLGQLLEVRPHRGARESPGDVERNVCQGFSGSGTGGRRLLEDRRLDLVVDGVVDEVGRALPGHSQVLRVNRQVLGRGNSVGQVGRNLEDVEPGAAAALAAGHPLLLNQRDGAVDFEP
jgi:hypothetical protein